jgi:hypothetical protein
MLYGVETQKVNIEARKALFLNFGFILYRPALGPTQSPIQLVPAALSPRIKRPGREADHTSF